MNLPNYISVFRILMIPVFLLLIIRRPPAYQAALIVFILASLSDALDGVLARRTNSITPLGKFIDPMADKLLLVCSFVALTVLGRIPLWLTVIVLSRDIILFLGWLGLYIVTGFKSISPSGISKITTFLQMVTIVFAIIGANFGGIIHMLTTLFTAASGLHYIIRTAFLLPDFQKKNNLE